MYMWMRLTAASVGFLLASCGPSQEQVAEEQAFRQQFATAKSATGKCQAEYGSLESRTRENAVPAAQCYLAAQKMYPTKDDTWVLFRQRNLFISEKYRDGAISADEFVYFINQSHAEAKNSYENKVARERLVKAQEQQAKEARCLSAKHAANTADSSGIESSNGFIAIISLLGAIARTVDVVREC